MHIYVHTYIKMEDLLNCQILWTEYSKYLHRFGHGTSPVCPNCVDEEENADHNLTCCPRVRWPGKMNLGPNGLMKELLNCSVLWSQYNQRTAIVMQNAED